MAIKNIISRVFIDDQSMSSSFNSSALRLLLAASSNIQLAFSGSPVGTFKLQSSADVTEVESELVNWDDIPDSSQAISAAGTHTWNINARYKWIRVVYTRSSGTGSCDGSVFAIEEV